MLRGEFVANFRRSKAVWVLAVLLVLVALYALGGFLLAPKLARSALIENIQKQLNVTPTVGDIRINPFLLQVEVKGFSLPDADGTKLVGFDRLFVDFGLSSLWHRAVVFKTIDIDGPFAHAVVATDGSVNLLRLQPTAPPSATPPPKSGPLPAIQIGDFSVSRGLVTYDDLSRPSHFSTRLEPINFDLRDFSTGSEGESGRFTFSGASKLGERIEWHGQLGVQPVQSDGDLRIDGLHARTIWEYLEDQLGFVVHSGTIDVAATYHFALRDSVELKVDVSKVTVSDLGLRAKEADVDWILVPTFSVSGASVDLAKREAHVDSVGLSGVKVTAWLNPDKSVNLTQLAAPPHPAAPPAALSPAPTTSTTTASTAAAPTAPTQTAASAAPPWRFDLREFSLQAASLSAEDRSTKPVAKLLLAPFSVKLTGLSQDLTKSVGFELDTGINGPGSLQLGGDVTPQPLAANLSVKLGGVDLTAIQPYLQQYTAMTLLGGHLSGDAKVRYGRDKPALQLTGNLRVDKLHTVDNTLHDDFISWDRLEVLGVKYSQGPDRLEIDQIVARKPYARVIIEADSSLNVKRVLTGPGAGAAPKPAKAAAAAKQPPNAGPAATAATAPRDTMPMAIRKILIQAGVANFSDLSIKPNFAASIQSLEGSVLGLSSKPNSRAKVDLHGQVDPFAPVAINGEVNVLGPTLYTDLAISFRNIELTMFNPYSGKFAGYNITKGKLTTEFHYKVDGRKLDAQHHVTVDQLEFGEKTASKDAVSLPVKLAVSLLKDRNGVIDLDLPVTGSLDDPQFRLGPLIWKVLLNLLVKAVTAPFALLGSLFGGGPDMQFIDFGPGLAALDGPATAKVNSVSKVLAERPQLKIEVPIASVPDVDRPALLQARFNAEVQDQLSAGRNAKAGVPFDQLEPRAKLELLSALYKKELGAAPTFAADAAGKSKDDIVADHVGFLEQQLRSHVTVADADLKALAEQRATLVQSALLAGTQIDPARIFLVVNDKAKAQDGQARLELVLQ